METIKDNLQLLIVSGVALAVLGGLIKTLPALLEAKVTAALERLFNEGDAADDAWLVATIAWAEAKYGAGTGAAKAAAVVEKIINLLPLQYRFFVSAKARAKAVELFQRCFDRVEAAALAAAAKNTPAA